ncbi:MAG: DUF4142 domain-containing protein [Rhizobiaceae bacterium]|nr:DUF4142 domain-containing protein [Rhizobiaceae bacterium]
MPILRLAIVSSVLLPLSTPVLAQSAGDSAAPTIPESQLEPVPAFSPYAFLTSAASSNDFEVKAAELALQKAEDAEVKAFAQMMLDDHTKAQQELIAAGEADKVEIGKPGVDGDQDRMLGRLELPSGAEFDRIYIETQAAAHIRAIALFQGYQDGETNLHAFAQKTLPTLSGHYAMAVKLAERLKVPLQAQ